MNTNQGYRIGPGATSLLMIFVALCMTTVSVLTLINAMHDAKMTERSQTKIAAYYAADVQVQQELANLDAKLAEARATGKLSAMRAALAPTDASADSGATDVYAYKVREIAAETAIEPITEDESGLTMTFAVPLDEMQQIAVKVQLPLTPVGPRYRVVSQVTQSIGEWTPDESITVF